MCILEMEYMFQGFQYINKLIRWGLERRGAVLFANYAVIFRRLTKAAAYLCGQPYVAGAWREGTLTNFRVIVRMMGLLITGDARASDKFGEQLEGLQMRYKLPVGVFLSAAWRSLNMYRESRGVRVPSVGVVSSDGVSSVVDCCLAGDTKTFKSQYYFNSWMVDYVYIRKAKKIIYRGGKFKNLGNFKFTSWFNLGIKKFKEKNLNLRTIRGLRWMCNVMYQLCGLSKHYLGFWSYWFFFIAYINVEFLNLLNKERATWCGKIEDVGLRARVNDVGKFITWTQDVRKHRILVFRNILRSRNKGGDSKKNPALVLPWSLALNLKPKDQVKLTAGSLEIKFKCKLGEHLNNGRTYKFWWDAAQTFTSRKSRQRNAKRNKFKRLRRSYIKRYIKVWRKHIFSRERKRLNLNRFYLRQKGFFWSFKFSLVNIFCKFYSFLWSYYYTYKGFILVDKWNKNSLSYFLKRNKTEEYIKHYLNLFKGARLSTLKIANLKDISKIRLLGESCWKGHVVKGISFDRVALSKHTKKKWYYLKQYNYNWSKYWDWKGVKGQYAKKTLKEIKGDPNWKKNLNKNVRNNYKKLKRRRKKLKNLGGNFGFGVKSLSLGWYYMLSKMKFIYFGLLNSKIYKKTKPVKRIPKTRSALKKRRRRIRRLRFSKKMMKGWRAWFEYCDKKERSKLLFEHASDIGNKKNKRSNFYITKDRAFKIPIGILKGRSFVYFRVLKERFSVKNLKYKSLSKIKLPLVYSNYFSKGKWYYPLNAMREIGQMRLVDRFWKKKRKKSILSKFILNKRIGNIFQTNVGFNFLKKSRERLNLARSDYKYKGLDKLKTIYTYMFYNKLIGLIKGVGFNIKKNRGKKSRNNINMNAWFLKNYGVISLWTKLMYKRSYGTSLVNINKKLNKMGYLKRVRKKKSNINLIRLYYSFFFRTEIAWAFTFIFV